MVQIHLLRKDFHGMSSSFKPKGRSNLPDELLKFGRNLVYSEGTKTEPYYIDNIKKCIAKKYSCQPNEISIIPVNKDKKNSVDTIRLAKRAIKDVERRIKKNEKIDNVWVFFDKDDFEDEDFLDAISTINNKNNSTTVNNNGFKYNTDTEIAWHACWSNEAFELWLCLYFNYDESRHSRDEYIDILNNNEKLKKIGFVYKKSKKEIHDILTSVGGKIENAIKFSKRLNEKNNYDNPSTNVCEFASFFVAYMECK